MARGSKFSFPIPGRRSSNKHDDTSSKSFVPPIPEWSPPVPDLNHPSKAERLLGTTTRAIYSSRKPQPIAITRSPVPIAKQSPGYMSISVSEASYDSHNSGMLSSTAVDEPLVPPRLPGLYPRASSNLLGASYNDGTGRTGSVSSSVSRQIHHQGSSSTLRSHYDSHKSPLNISQQTSASAVRDMALRKGQPPIRIMHDNHSSTSLASAHTQSTQKSKKSEKKPSKKTKPRKLDLSKLFPKPRGNGDRNTEGLLSPTKMVDSPAALSTASDFFPPQPQYLYDSPQSSASLKGSMKSEGKSSAKSKKNQSRGLSAAQEKARQISVQRDMYDNAKVNVRRPPQGIQHWFEAIDDESDEQEEELKPPVHSHPQQTRSSYASRDPSSSLALSSNYQPFQSAPELRLQTQGPVKKNSPGLPMPSEPSPSSSQHSQQLEHMIERERRHLAHALEQTHRLNSSQYSLGSMTSGRTKESKFSTNNLQKSSVLSMSSSSEDEDDEPSDHKYPPIRESVGSTDTVPVVGKAQVLDVRHGRQDKPGLHRHPSDSMQSVRSISTNAATIQVMLDPCSPPTLQLPRNSLAWRRSRKPSVIAEDDDRPKTSAHSDVLQDGRSSSPSSMATSIRSGKTSKSEPPRPDNHKLMAVTEEEEALLEMMRRKRAAMQKMSFTEGYQSAIQKEQKQRAETPSLINDTPPRTSVYSGSQSPDFMHGFPMPASSTHTKNSSLASSSPRLSPSSARSYPKKSRYNTHIINTLRDPSPAGSRNSRYGSPLSPPPRLPATLEFSPLDVGFPTPNRLSMAMSATSPTTASHASPIPSPITPRFHQHDSDIDVKVAGSEPSTNGDEEISITPTGIIEPLASPLKDPRSSQTSSNSRSRPRRRTASSGANVAVSTKDADDLSKEAARESVHSASEFPVPPGLEFASHDRKTEHSETRTPSSSRRAPNMPSGASAASRSRMSVASGSSALSAPRERSRDSRSKTRQSRESVVGALRGGDLSARCSVSEDVLAAWGSLGGLRDWDGGRVGGFLIDPSALPSLPPTH